MHSPPCRTEDTESWCVWGNALFQFIKRSVPLKRLLDELADFVRYIHRFLQECGALDGITLARFNECPQQWVNTALGSSQAICVATPVQCPVMFDAPLKHWPRHRLQLRFSLRTQS